MLDIRTEIVYTVESGLLDATNKAKEPRPAAGFFYLGAAPKTLPAPSRRVNLMVDQRLFHKDILQSSLYYQLGESFPGKELHAQRLFETLILIADDYGRGRFIQADLRTRAFSSAPTAFANVSLDDIDCFMGIIEKNGSAYRYTIGLEVYFFMPKWFEYQALKYRAKSHITPPSADLLANLGLFLADSGEILPLGEKNEDELDKNAPKRKRREEKSREEKKELTLNLSSFDLEYVNLVDELFPPADYKNWTPVQRLKQVDALDKLIRIDKFPQEEVFSVLRWMRSQTEPNGEFPGWSAVFQSIPRLRENGQRKYVSAKKQWEQTRGRAHIPDPSFDAEMKEHVRRCAKDVGRGE
jgi:hypothetical protein